MTVEVRKLAGVRHGRSARARSPHVFVGVILSAALGLCCAARLVRAAEPPPAGSSPLVDTHAEPFLVWHAPAGCATAAAIRERVRELSGEPELDLNRVRRVEGRVSETSSGWALELTLVNATGTRQRRLSSQHCEDLAEAAAVAITLAFEAARSHEALALEARADDDSPREGMPVERDPSAGAAVSAASVGTLAPSSRGPNVEAVEPGARTSAPTPSRSSRSVSVGAELLLDVNSLPVPSPGPSLLAALRWVNLRIGVHAGWLPGSERSLGPGQSVAFTMLLGGVRACYALGHGLLDTALCAGLEAGRLSARGSGLLGARRADDPWLAPLLGLELSAPVSEHIIIHARADAIAPVLRQGYAVNDTEDVHHVRSVGVRVALGLSWALTR